MKFKISASLPSGYVWDHDVPSGDEMSILTGKVWPNYLISKSDIEEPAAATSLSDQELSQRFLMWGIRRESDGKLVAFASAVLFAADSMAEKYSERGWHFALDSYYVGGVANCLCLLSANVDPEFRSLKFSYSLIQFAKEAAESLGLACVLAPVRPTLKSQYPLMPIKEYLNKRSESGDIFDPWLRVHAKLGGEILNICFESVLIRATLAKWQEWLGKMPGPSEVVVPEMGLVPLEVDVQGGIATYCEPNVWVRYSIRSAS